MNHYVTLIDLKEHMYLVYNYFVFSKVSSMAVY